jgi:hypothetical protein
MIMETEIKDYRDIKKIRVGDRIRIGDVTTTLIRHYDDGDYGFVTNDSVNTKAIPRMLTRFVAHTSVKTGAVTVFHVTDDEPKKPKTIHNCKGEMLRSFMRSVNDASGDMLSMIDANPTLWEMIDTLAQNGIRFTYDPDGVHSIG